jgi:hypothetical protein
MNSRIFALLLPLLFLMVVGIGFPSTCYQESVNVANQGSYYGNPDGNCTLFYNGTYLTTGTWYLSNTTLYDGNWASGAYSSGTSLLYANYTTPIGMSYYGNQLQIGDDNGKSNATIDFTCMDLANTTGILQIYCSLMTGSTYLTCGCIGTGGNTAIFSSINTSYLWDEAMNWNVTGGGGANASIVAKIPSYPNSNTNLPLWANITFSGGGTTTAYYEIRRNASVIASGSTSGISSGIMTNIANLSGYYVTENATFFAYVYSDATGSINAITNTATARNRAYYIHTLPYLTGLGENETIEIDAHLTSSPSLYGYADCDFVSPSYVHYYPPNAVGTSTYCKLIDLGNPKQFNVSMMMNESGNWGLASCSLYLSNYSTCPVWDNSNHALYIGLGGWYVASAPIVTQIYVTPTSPLGSDNINCYAKLTSENNSTINASVGWKLNGYSWGSPNSILVSNNTLTLVSTLPSSQTSVGEDISCEVRGYDGNYGSWATSNTAHVVGYGLTGISTAPEPSIFGSTKYLNFTTGRGTTTMRVEFTRPYGSTGEYYSSDSYGTSHSFMLQSDSPSFNESGNYYYTVKACACSEADFGTVSCSDDLCASPLDYPTKSRVMRWGMADNMYLYDTAITSANLEYGKTQQVYSKFSKPTNIFKAVVTYPDSSVRTFIEIVDNETTGYLYLTSGFGRDLNQTGTYMIDLYAGFGWFSSTSDCLETSECSYDNSTLGLTFDVNYGSGGVIENLTTVPTTPIYGNDLNITFDVSNKTDSTCLVFQRPLSGIPRSKRILNANTTHWSSIVTTGNGKYLDSDNIGIDGGLVGWGYDIKTCKNNGTATCQNSDCTISTPSNCEYCVEQKDNTLLFGDASITDITYKSTLAVGESQEINFVVIGGTNNTQIRLPSLIVDEADVRHIFISPDARVNWSVTIPYSEIRQAICSESNSTTTCVYGHIPFIIESYSDSGILLLQSEPNYFAVNISSILGFDERTDGTIGGNIIGGLFNVSGKIGDMIMSLVLILLATISVTALLSKVTQSPQALGIIAVGTFIVGVGICTLAGWLPIWLLLVIVIICSGIIVQLFRGGISGGA